MPLLLPIVGRSAEDSAYARRRSSLLSGIAPSESPSAASDDESSSSEGLKLAVKNTFIDVEAFEGEEKQELRAHQLGAQTCTARLSQIGRFPDAEQEEESTEASDNEYSEIENILSNTFPIEATPEAQSMRQFLSSAAFNVPPSEAQDLEQQPAACPAPVPECQVPEPTPQKRQVTLQLPLEVGAGQQASGGDMQVAVLDSSSESLGGCTVLDLRIVVGPSGELEIFQSAAGQVLLSACLGSLAANMASADGAASKAAKPPSTPTPEAAAPAADTPGTEAPLLPVQRRAMRARTTPTPTGGKSSMVCCHWKNKGWCKYQDNCRFMHPEHKRGVGLGACKGAVGAGILASSSPARLSVGGRHHLQQTGSSSARHLTLPAGMWGVPPDWAGCAFVQQL